MSVPSEYDTLEHMRKLRNGEFYSGSVSVVGMKSSRPVTCGVCRESTVVPLECVLCTLVHRQDATMLFSSRNSDVLSTGALKTCLKVCESCLLDPAVRR